MRVAHYLVKKGDVQSPGKGTRYSLVGSLTSLGTKEAEMQSYTKMEATMLSILAVVCYVFTITLSGLAFYALINLSHLAFGGGETLVGK